MPVTLFYFPSENSSSLHAFKETDVFRDLRKFHNEGQIDFHSISKNEFHGICSYDFRKPLDDHNLLSIEKKNPAFTTLYSLYKQRLKTINWFMNHSFGILLGGIKFPPHLIDFKTSFELQLQKATKFFSYF